MLSRDTLFPCRYSRALIVKVPGENVREHRRTTSNTDTAVGSRKADQDISDRVEKQRGKYTITPSIIVPAWNSSGRCTPLPGEPLGGGMQREAAVAMARRCDAAEAARGADHITRTHGTWDLTASRRLLDQHDSRVHPDPEVTVMCTLLYFVLLCTSTPPHFRENYWTFYCATFIR